MRVAKVGCVFENWYFYLNIIYHHTFAYISCEL